MEETRQFNTIMKLSTIERLDILAKNNCDAFGKWSYDVTLNKLMDLYEFLKDSSSLDKRVFEIEVEIRGNKNE